MSTTKLDQRLERIESLLLAKKKVLMLEEAHGHTGMSRSFALILLHQAKE